MNNVSVIKIGGSTLGKRDTTIEDIVALQQMGHSMVVVHGGGNAVTAWLKRQGVETKFVKGERVTDLPTLEVATAVLAGLVNKEIVGAVNCAGGRAVGISGVDGALIEGRMKSEEMGYVGMVEKVNAGLLYALLDARFVPVVSSISLYAVDRPAESAPLININGDPIAGDIAAALLAERLIFLTDVPGISGRDGRVIERLSAAQAESLIENGVISGGMIPKINASLRALNEGVITRIIDGRQPHALLNELEGRDGGTTIFKG
jgi:acetylglutamate kinase